MKEPLEQRLTAHLGEQAEDIDPIDQGVERVMSAGRRKRTTRVMMLGAAAGLAVIGLAVGAIAVFGNRHDDQTIQPAIRPLSLGLPDATKVAAHFDWTVEASSSTAGQFGTSPWWSGASSNGVSSYTFGTVPHAADQPAEQQLWSTSDGIDYQAAGVAFDPWIVGLDSSTADRIYAIGTVPDGLSFGYQTGVTTDSGTTWTTDMLPLDLSQVRTDLGGLSTIGAQVVDGGGNVVAIVQTTGFAANLAIDGVDTQYGTLVTADGVEVYGAPDDLAAVAERECPPRWPLAKGPPREFVTEETAPVATTVPFGPRGMVNEWHCESPDSGEPDVWVDPSRIHGDVAQVVPFERLHMADASIKALRNAVRVFHSTDGTSWTEVELPAGGSNSFPPNLLWTGSQFALRTPGAGTGELWLSADGLTWQEGTLPAATDGMSFGALPDGSLLLAGRQAGEVVAYTSTDGREWKGVSLSALLGLDPTWRSSQYQLVTSTDGASLMISATADGFATLGPPVVDHGRYQLRLSDSQGGAELLDGDGNVIDRIDSVWQMAGFTGFEGRLATTGSGSVSVIDPTSGDVVDVFTQSEIQLKSDEVWSTAKGQQFQSKNPPGAWWALDTIDGTNWGVSRIDGISAVTSWLAATGRATPGGHAFRFAVGEVAAVVIGRRPA